MTKHDLCEICYRKIGIFHNNLKLADGSIICNRCKQTIPDYMINSAMTEWSINTLRSYIAYKTNNSDKMARIFTETAHYKNVYIDAKQGLFFISNKGIKDVSKTTILAMVNIKKCEFTVKKIKSVKNTLGYGNHITGDIVLCLGMNKPSFYTEIMLSENQSFKTSMNNGKLEYEMPKDAQIFQGIFINTAQSKISEIQEYNKKGYRQNNNAKQEKHNENEKSKEKEASELSKALSLFMIDESEVKGITQETLRKQRNMLLKTYHPDEGDVDSGKYVQKINNAYALLCKMFA